LISVVISSVVESSFDLTVSSSLSLSVAPHVVLKSV